MKIKNKKELVNFIKYIYKKDYTVVFDGKVYKSPYNFLGELKKRRTLRTEVGLTVPIVHKNKNTNDYIIITRFNGINELISGHIEKDEKNIIRELEHESQFLTLIDW